MMNTYTTVVLAAGKGTRMRSHLPKVLHAIAGRPLIDHVLAAIAAIPPDALGSPALPVLVLGHEAERVQSVLGAGYRYVHQHEQLGTGHAVHQALDALRQWGPLPRSLLVLYGDTPLITAETLTTLLAVHREQEAVLTLVTAIAPDPAGYGRILRNAAGRVLGIREEKQCDERERAITEINTGIYCFDAVWLAERIATLRPHASGEYYLTDMAAFAAQEQQRIAAVTASWEEVLGVNDRHQLAEAGAILRRRILARHLLAGVTIVDPATTYIDVDVTIGRDTIIAPCTTVGAGTTIGEECIIGPCSTLIATQVGDRCAVPHACLDHVVLAAGCSLEPYSVLRAESSAAAIVAGEPVMGAERQDAPPLLTHPLWTRPYADDRSEV